MHVLNFQYTTFQKMSCIIFTGSEGFRGEEESGKWLQNRYDDGFQMLDLKKCKQKQRKQRE